jgi:putative ABC transport system permease protein
MNLHTVSLWLRALFRRDRMERQLAEELDFHLEMQARKHRAAGADADEARAEARREFGNVELVKEDSRDMRHVRALEEAAQDIRFGARLLRRSPTFAIVAIVAIGLAIGINAGFFTLIDAFVWRPVPVVRPERLVKVGLRFSNGGGSIVFAHPQVEAIVAHSTTLVDVMPEARCVPIALRPSPSGKTLVTAAGCVSGNYFAALGGDATVGRPLLPSDDRIGAPPVVVLSDGFWARVFSRAPDIVGRDVIVNGSHATVAGVIRREFVGVRPLVPDVWMTNATAVAVGATPGRLDDPSNRFFDMKARVREGVTREQAEAELSGLVAETPPPGADADAARITGIRLMPNDAMLKLDWTTSLALAPVVIVVALVLVIACANLANLMLSRALVRQREIGVRLAMGASRGRLVRQLLTEGLLIAFAGAVLGLVLSRWTVATVSRAFFASVPATFGTIALDLSPSWRVVAYTVGLAGIAVVLFGLAPALQVTSQSLTAALKGEDNMLGTRIRRSRFRDALIAAQVAGSLVLLVASGTLIASMRGFGANAAGLDAARVTTATLGLAAQGRVPPSLASARATFAARVNGLPQAAVTAQAMRPLFTSWWPFLSVAPAGGSPSFRQFAYNVVTPHYFDVVRQPLLSGRSFNAADSATGANLAIVTTSAAQTLWPGATAVDQQLRVLEGRDEPDRIYRVVGVASDAHSQAVWDADDAGHIYLAASARDLEMNDMVLLVRADAPQPAIMRAIEDVAQSVAADVPLRVEPALAARELTITPLRYGTWITTGVGAFGLGLALIGLYGVVSFTVAQRRRDLAVHVAMGASPRDVMRLVLARELKLIGVGLAVGLLLSTVEGQLIGAFFVPLASLGPGALVALSALLFSVAGVACAVPARSALGLPPMTVLRQE